MYNITRINLTGVNSGKITLILTCNILKLSSSKSDSVTRSESNSNCASINGDVNSTPGRINFIVAKAIKLILRKEKTIHRGNITLKKKNLIDHFKNP